MGVFVYPPTIDGAMLIRKREQLRAWQAARWFKAPAPGQTRLHLGCGKVHLPYALNIDFTPEADIQADLRTYDYGVATVDDIICQHVLEHLPMRDVPPLLARWFAALRPGGIVEIGVPDMDLIARCWLDSSDEARWRWLNWTIYGSQTDEPCGYPWEARTYNPYQTHQSAFTLGYLIRLLERTGFRIRDAYWYDAHETPGAFVLAVKPESTRPPTVLEQQCAIGTFTHRCDYLPALWQSAAQHLPQVDFITVLRTGTIRENMARLRNEFLASGKRYWVFLDDDIQFLNAEIIEHALEVMQGEGYAAMHAYSMFEPEALSTPYDPGRYPGVVAREAAWATGYFIMVDSHKVGHIEPDANLPDGNTAVDTSYSVAIRAAGYRIGMTPDYVYHTLKPGSWVNPAVIEPTNRYLWQRWGQFYFDIAKYDRNIIGWEAV